MEVKAVMSNLSNHYLWYIHITAKNLVLLIFVGFNEVLPEYHQHLSAKCLVLALHFVAEHYQSLATAVTNSEQKLSQV